MTILTRFLPLVTVSCFLAGHLVAAQVRSAVAPKHEEFRSGGATVPDLEPKPSSLAAPVKISPTRTGQLQQVSTNEQLQVGANVQVNDPQQPFPNGLLGRSETTIAGTQDGQLLLAGFNDAQGFCGPPFGSKCTPENPPGLSGFAFSLDAGLTWTDSGAPDPKLFNNVFTRGDPWMDRGGLDTLTFYYANLAVDATSGDSLGISVHRGHFDANNNNKFAFEDVRVLGPGPNDSFDKEAIAAAKDGSGAAYVTFTNFITTCGIAANGFGQIEVFRTQDGGNSYQGPVIISPDQTFITDPSNPACGKTGILQQSSAPAIGPSGEVYVAWQFGPTFNPGLVPTAQISVARSLDGGVTFNSPVTVAAINSLRADPPVGYNRSRLNDHPRIFVAASGPFAGRVFVVFYSAVSQVGPAPAVTCPTGLPPGTTCIDQNLVSSQVFISFSDDRGQTWSTPTPLASAVPPTGVKRWWPVVTVASGGQVNVVYNESQETQTSSNPQCVINVGGGVRRVGSANSLVDTFVVQSIDGGSTFTTPVRVSAATSNWCTAVSNIRPNFGDYIGSDIAGDTILAVWGDGRNGVPDTFFAPIFF